MNATVQELYDALKEIVEDGNGHLPVDGIGSFSRSDAFVDKQYARVYIRARISEDERKAAYNEGWNDCIDEIDIPMER